KVLDVFLRYLAGEVRVLANWACRAAKPRRASIGDPEGVLELLWFLMTTVLAWERPRQDLVLENLLLRHQLAVLTRATRTRPRTRFHAWDKLPWILARVLATPARKHPISLTSIDSALGGCIKNVRWPGLSAHSGIAHP